MENLGVWFPILLLGCGGIVDVGAAEDEISTAGVGTAGEEDGTACRWTGGGAGRDVGGGGADGAGEDAIFSPPRPFLSRVGAARNP